jgi:hypothetical protein
MISFYILSALLYILLTAYTCFRIARSIVLSRQQKIMNGIISALVPLAWYFLIRPVIFPKHKLITKEDREKMNRMESGIRIPPTPGSTTDYL